MERYNFRRGAVVIVHSSCNNDNPSKEWVPEEAQTNDIGHLRHLLTRRGFEVVLEMGPNTDLLQPTVVDIEQKISDLASTWKWDDDYFDALIVIIAAHGTLDRITGWPLPGENKKSGPLDLADKIFRHFQLTIQGQSSTRASEALKGKPKVFIMDACRGIDTTDASAEVRNPQHPLAWTPAPGKSSSGVDGLPLAKRRVPGGHYDAVTAGGEALTRYTDFLFCWATMPFNVSGMTKANSCFLGCLFNALKATPTASLVDILTAAAAAMPKKYARLSGEVGRQNLPQAAELGPVTLRMTLRLVIQHSAILDSARLPGELFGRKDDAEKLEKALREASNDHGCPYYVVLGSAGLGKTELVMSVGRALLADGSGARFSAIIFVQLRARDSETLVREAICAAWQGAGLLEASQMRDALVILDNADDPYKVTSNVTEPSRGWFEFGLLDELMTHQPAAILITMRDEGQRSLFNKSALRGAYKTNLAPLQREDGRSMLRQLLNPEMQPELEASEEDDVLQACGSRGVSPLALTIVCGVLISEFADPLYDQNDRCEYLKQLIVAISDPQGDFYEVQKVMGISFKYVPDELRRHFLELHLFPDQFTIQDAEALWPAAQASNVKKMLVDLKRYNLLSYTSTEAGTHTFLMLDHIWVFAARGAEDPASEWLSRAEYASALLRLFRLANTRWPPGTRGEETLPRLFHHIKERATKMMKVASGDKPCPPQSGDEPASYRSLAAESPLDLGFRPLGAETVTDRKLPDGFRPLGAGDISDELRDEASKVLNS